MRTSLLIGIVVCATSLEILDAFAPVLQKRITTSLRMGLFDNFGKDEDREKRRQEQWKVQQEILKERRKPKEDREKYFQKVEERRKKATEKQNEMWSWQTKKYGKGEDPIDEWRKRRADGTIPDIDDQYGDPKEIGGIPLPMASFGVGGEFGVGGKYDNGGRFDLRLPYAEQGYVDEDADVVKKIFNFFGGKNKEKKEDAPKKPEAKKEAAPKKPKWPWG
eukprot:CAMPEP_0116860598 /NCGR_PEP_ID=MMETSP0418-20121206/22504_1 /TAXON_ID=1158023 /ORGANISM="Astrosyne radiata, Strain 13vi08-1A" /LENGTH=219 /DNA_ID=CAMNT_0004495023 /DNA_START=98 /DNA_END=757 /DNA_ORIENTATION=+